MQALYLRINKSVCYSCTEGKVGDFFSRKIHEKSKFDSDTVHLNFKWPFYLKVINLEPYFCSDYTVDQCSRILFQRQNRISKFRVEMQETGIPEQEFGCTALQNVFKVPRLSNSRNATRLPYNSLGW